MKKYDRERFGKRTEEQKDSKRKRAIERWGKGQMNRRKEKGRWLERGQERKGKPNQKQQNLKRPNHRPR